MCYYRDSFTCSDGTCIDSMAVCDGTANCLDGSDETQILCTRLIPMYEQKYGNSNFFKSFNV